MQKTLSRECSSTTIPYCPLDEAQTARSREILYQPVTMKHSAMLLLLHLHGFHLAHLCRHPSCHRRAGTLSGLIEVHLAAALFALEYRRSMLDHTAERIQLTAEPQHQLRGGAPFLGPRTEFLMLAPEATQLHLARTPHSVP
jgi:hypothetical protein